MKTVTTLLSTSLAQPEHFKGKVAVVADIFRATSTITAALSLGAKAVLPVASIEEVIFLTNGQDMIGAAERKGKPVPGISLTNSPTQLANADIAGKTIVLSTSNGTQAMLQAKWADKVFAGSFLQVGALANALLAADSSVVIHCAGWLGQPCLEDTLFAGALTDRLLHHGYEIGNDGTQMAYLLWKEHHAKPEALLQQSSHYKRLARLGQLADIQFCLQIDSLPIVACLDNDRLVTC